MKKNPNRFPAILLTLCLLLSLAACGGAETTGTDTVGETESTSTDTAEQTAAAEDDIGYQVSYVSLDEAALIQNRAQIYVDEQG